MLRKKLKVDEDCYIPNTLIVERKNEIGALGFNQNLPSRIVTSPYFEKPYWLKLFEIECELNEEIKDLKFGAPVAAVYNPLIYASELHSAYLKKFLDGPKEVVLIGMNPGPWGMCQTGVIHIYLKFIII